MDSKIHTNLDVWIKGPEILSKYIGASEQAVRDLFIRLVTVQPSVQELKYFSTELRQLNHVCYFLMNSTH